MTRHDADAAAERALSAALLAAEPTGTRFLGGLLARLRGAGRLRGVVAPGGVDIATEPSAVVSRPVAGIAYDSRAVVSDGCFVAVPGAHVDGHSFARAAVAAGARTLIVERPQPAGGAGPAVQLVVDRSQWALAPAAAWWYEDPGALLGVIGVTGTDGKTTTAGFAVAALEAAGVRTGLISTAEQKVGALRATTFSHVTTPEAPELQRSLRAIARAGDVAAVVETTSHGLALERVAEIPYDVAIFTNLTHEHLELHGTFEAYLAAKLSLFERLAGPAGRPPKPPTIQGGWPRGGIVNADDPAAPAFAAATRAAGARLITFGVGGRADVRAFDLREGQAGIRGRLATPRASGELRLRLIGGFNVRNALAAVALGELLGLDLDAVLDGIAALPGVRGRMERIPTGMPYQVVVDYAHTPASLEVTLEALRPLVGPTGGLIAVFGSAGERDVAKRPLQGRVAGERCRLVVLADEDPRGEDSMTILDEIAVGAEAAGKRRGEDLLLVADRREAIAAALARARPGDVVLLAGKGHERSIIYADGERAWDERAVAEELLGFPGRVGPGA